MLNIPIIKQRLIFQGKWLQNNTDKLRQYRISDENVIHLVAKTYEENSQININNNVNNITNTNNANSNNNSQLNIEDAFNGLIEIPLIRSGRRARRRRSI